MKAWLTHLDELLRGHRTEPEALARDRIDLPLARYGILAIILGAIYGFFMGWFSLINRTPVNPFQLIASMIKLPALFLLTLMVTLPSLYTFSTLVGCRISFKATVRLLVGAITVNLAVAASFGTILGFFTLSTTSYPFMVILNVALLGTAGLVGLGFLLRTLQRLTAWQSSEVVDSAPLQDASRIEHPTPNSTVESVPSDVQRPAPAEVAFKNANRIFQVWVIIYALVGAQMAWILRPFIGSPNMPFTWFRPRSGNFFQAVFGSISKLLESAS